MVKEVIEEYQWSQGNQKLYNDKCTTMVKKDIMPNFIDCDELKVILQYPPKR